MASSGRTHALSRASPSRPRPRGKAGARSMGNGRAQDRGVAALLLLGIFALLVSGLTSTYVPRLVKWRQGADCVPGDTTPCLPENHHPDIDVVSVVVKPTCVTKVSVQGINQYIAPRRIHFITKDEHACEIILKFANNIRCYPQDTLVPGLTKQTVSDELQNLYSEKADASGTYMGRELAGWYLQQLLKLGAARHLPYLSHTFLVWDPDMIPLEPFRVFSKERSGATGKERVMRHVGGYVIKEYEYAYEKLTQEQLANAPDGSSYVTHAMLFERSIVEELLGMFSDAWEDRIREEAKKMSDKVKAGSARDGAIGRVDSVGVGRIGGARGIKELGDRRWKESNEFGDEQNLRNSNPGMHHSKKHPPTWAKAILASLNPTRLDLGFSEYASYASYVATHHPETVEVVPHRTWTRHPLGPFLGSFGIKILKRWSPVVGKCCPSAFAVRLMKLLGYQYGGFEVGHVASCGYDSPENQDSYGVPESNIFRSRDF